MVFDNREIKYKNCISKQNNQKHVYYYTVVITVSVAVFNLQS